MLMAFASLLLCAAARAESTSDKLMQIEAETMLLKAREKQLDVRAKVVARELEIASKRAESERVIQPSAAGNPLVHSIEGMGRSMYATLQLPGGALIDVQAGDVLDNGMRVLSIRSNEVIIQSAKKHPVRLGLMPVWPATAEPGHAGAGPRLPPPPMALPRGN
jgi:type IV pilus biogenesis protein PilP